MIKVYGHSDDVIVVQGDITEEFCPGSDDESSYLAFSDGTVLGIQYDKDGIWRINRMVTGHATYTKTEGIDDGPSGNPNVGTDIVILDAEIHWVLGGEVFARHKADA